MNPFYFGSSERPLFGVYHPPAGPDRGRAVVLCYPVGDEYLRAHRAFRQLTTLLVREGMHVLRFDYSGTGDSAGDAEEARLAHWLEDIGAAIAELKDSSGIRRVSLAGLRLGATMGAAAAVGRSDVDALVLWDPLHAGRAQLLAVEGGGAVERSGVFPRGTVGTGGFPITPDLREELELLELAALALPTGSALRRLDILVPEPRDALHAVAREWADEGLRTRYRVVPSEGDWSKGDRFGSALIPQAIIQEVVRSLSEPYPRPVSDGEAP